MIATCKICFCTIHRHIGGLEIEHHALIRNDKIHRHIGGLEKFSGIDTGFDMIHRHIGGLEILICG